MDKTINITSTDKDIGVIIDDQLSFSKDLNEKINKANRIVGVIRFFVHLDLTTFEPLFTATNFQTICGGPSPLPPGEKH